MYEANELRNTISSDAIKLVAQRLDVQGQCAFCDEEFVLNVRGRPRIYCSESCKQKAKRTRSKLSEAKENG